MNIFTFFRRDLRLLHLVVLMTATGALWSQGNSRNLRVVENCGRSVELVWDGAAGDGDYYLYQNDGFQQFGPTGGTSFVMENLGGRQFYSFDLYSTAGEVGRIDFVARKESCNPSPPQTAPIFSCAERRDRVLINGLGSGAHCQSVGAFGVGVPSLVAQGVIDAVDIWGRDSDVEVCFHNHGVLKFLDAATSPRQVMDLPAAQINGMTCGQINRAGTVVLLQAAATATKQTESQPAPVVDESAAPAETAEIAEDDPVAACQLLTTVYVSLRVGPSLNYARLDVVPPNRRLVAMAKTEAWYRVAFSGQIGWISAEYVDASGNCDTVSDTVAIIWPPATPEAAQTQEPETAAPTEEAPADAPGRMGAGLTACRLRAGDIINLRSGPGLDHDVILEIPFLTDLTATDRFWDWFQVEYEGIMGWVNIEVVFRNGDCG